MAGEGPLSAGAPARTAPSLPPALRPLAAARPPRRLAPRLPGGEVYTDDRAPVEWLVDSSLLEYANGE